MSRLIAQAVCVDSETEATFDGEVAPALYGVGFSGAHGVTFRCDLRRPCGHPVAFGLPNPGESWILKIVNHMAMDQYL